jgi:cyclophilin family peptidyl-prolyl cis-trans isomerase/HEAT repeat protein
MFASFLLAAVIAAAPSLAAAVERVDEQAILLIEAQRLPPMALDDFVRSDNAATRVRAARALGRLRDSDSIPALDELARDTEVSVRAEAAWALGQSPGSERSILAHLTTETDPTVRPLLIEALGRQAEVAGLRTLVDALHQKVTFPHTPDEARAAAQALGHVALRNRDALTRPDTIAELAQQLHRFDRDTRRAAAFALARLRPERVNPDTAEQLLDRARTEPDAVTQAFLVRAIASIDDLGPRRDQVYSLTARDPSPSVRIATARAAAASGWSGVTTLLSDPDTHVRHVAIEAVGAMPSLDRAALLLPIVQAGDTLDAAEDLMTTENPRLLDAAVALEALASAELLPDPAPWLAPNRPTRIRAAAVGALFGELRLLRLALEDNEAPVRTAAAMQLVEVEPSTDILVQALSASDTMVAAIAAEALAERKSADTEEPLIAAVTDALDADLLAYGLGALAALYTGDPPAVSKVPSAAVDLARLNSSHDHSRVLAACRDILRAANEAVPPDWHHLVTVPYPDVLDILSARVQTDRGEFIIDLKPELAPVTVWNFAKLADDGWYDGVLWHRVVPDFVVQTGDPRGDGTGGPSWTLPDEINRLSYDEGVVGMAHAGADTAGSQWFVTLSPQPHLDGTYTAFGRVVRGMQVVDTLQPSDRIRSVIIERRAP